MVNLPRYTIVIAVMMSSREFPIRAQGYYPFFDLKLKSMRYIVPFVVNAHA